MDPSPEPEPETSPHPSAWDRPRSATCSICGARGQLRVYGWSGLIQVVVCPDGHGVIRRAWT